MRDSETNNYLSALFMFLTTYAMQLLVFTGKLVVAGAVLVIVGTKDAKVETAIKEAPVPWWQQRCCRHGR